MAKGTTKDPAALTGISDASVEKATGKTWQQWMDLLDREEAAERSHKEIAKLLENFTGNAWWCQSIALAYERHKGKRVRGQTSDGKFQLGVSKTVYLDNDRLWELLSSERGMETWLGRIREGKGAPEGTYRTQDGVSGEITVLKPGSHFRMTWRPANWDHSSVLQVRTVPKKDRSVLTFHHEGLASLREREEMKAYWTERMNRLLNLLEQARGS
ncbi:MAG TPA: SRPBCC domain-containing protein [Anseongella sp.]|nr:SRPBCC domain-containing protein [Anseongella sp.]